MGGPVGRSVVYNRRYCPLGYTGKYEWVSSAESTKTWSAHPVFGTSHVMPAAENRHGCETHFCTTRVFLTWLIVCVATCLVYALIAFVSLLDKNILPEEGLQAIPYVNVPERYNIRLIFGTEFDKSNKSFQGEVTIIFKCLQASQNIHFHRGRNLVIKDSSLIHQEVSTEKFTVRKGTYDESAEIQTLLLSSNTTAEKLYELTLKFSGYFLTTKGVKEFTYPSERGEKRYGLYFAVEHQFNDGLRYLFPCFDSPDYPAYFNLVVDRKESLRTLFNFASSKTKPSSPNFMEDHYVSSVKLLPTQLALVLCDFQYKRQNYNGVDISIYSRPEVLSDIPIRRIAQFMDSTSEKIGKNDAVLIPEVTTMYRPGISLINENEAVRESKDYKSITP